MDSSHLPPFDALIIGAGPAGSVAATMLARANVRVAILEQSRFPRNKVCGECLSAMGISVLRRQQLFRYLEHHQPVRLTKAEIHATDGTALELELPSEMLGLSRHAMDSSLLSAAKEAGAVVFQPARVEKLQQTSVTFRDLESNAVLDLQAHLVLLADGKGMFSARTAAPSGDLGMKCHLRGVDAARDAIQLFGVNGHYAGLAPIEDDVWNLAFSIPVSRVSSVRGDLDCLLREMCRQNRSFATCLRVAERVSDWLTCPLPRFPVASAWDRNVIPLGNAAAALEPIGGEGMGLAMRSAEIACNEIVAARDESRAINAAKLRAQFDSLWRIRRFACRTAATALSRPRIASIALDFLGQFSALHQPAMRLVGKAD